MALADIALERLTRIAPQLAKQVISFYDMTEELPEDSGMHVGVFILGSKNNQYYIPVVAKGGTVYPIDSVYSKEESRFIPITTKGIDEVVSSSQQKMGRGAKMPKTVNSNPNLRDVVEPPRTGKYVYSGVPIPEALAQLSDEGKGWFLDKIASEQELMKSIHDLGVDIPDMKEALLTKSAMINDHEKLNTDAPVEVVTQPKDGLSDETIRMIMRQGFAIVGEHPHPRMAVEYCKATEGFTRIPAACENKAYEVVMRDGRNKVGFVPDFVKSCGLKEMPKRSATSDGPSQDPIIIFEDGTYAHTHNTVIRQIPRDFVAVLKELSDNNRFVDLSSCSKDDTVMVVTPKGFVGPVGISSITSSPAGTCIKTYNCGHSGTSEIFVSDNVHGEVLRDGSTVYVTPSAKAIKLDSMCDHGVETDLNRAITRYENSQMNIVKEAHVLDFDGVEYHLDKTPVGTIEKIAEELAVNHKLDADTTEYFIKRAQELGRVVIQMSKEAEINGIGPEDNSTTTAADLYAPTGKTHIPEYGDKINPEDGSAIGARRDLSGGLKDKQKEKEGLRKKASFNLDLIKEAAATKDKQIVEASVMSEILKDPAMGETISSYMPIIDEALDKLGRTILLLRINNENMLDKISPEEYSKLISALRNTYKLLGENKLTLEQLVTDGGKG